MSEEIPTVGKAKIWERSGLIEELVCYDQSVFQTKEFDREKEGKLERYEVIRRKDTVDFVKSHYKDTDGEGPQPEDTPGKNFDRGWDAALSLIADRISGDLPASAEKKTDEVESQ